MVDTQFLMFRPGLPDVEMGVPQNELNSIRLS